MAPWSLPLKRRLHLPRLADAVADMIRDAILLGQLEDGERLPTVDTLGGHFEVSAPTMREALRMLEAEGLIVVKRGGIGGAVVRRPTARTAAYTLALVLCSQGTEKGDVSDAIALLQPLSAQMCARRPDRKTKVVRELRRLNDAARALVNGDELLFNDAMIEFHRTLVRLAGNHTLSLVTSALEDIWFSDVRNWVRSVAAHGEYPTAGQREEEVALHEQITDLIAAGDEAGAARAMRQHIDDSVYRKLSAREERVDPKTVRFGPGHG